MVFRKKFVFYCRTSVGKVLSIFLSVVALTVVKLPELPIYLVVSEDESKVARAQYWDSYWGDDYGNRMDRFFIGAAYLDGIPDEKTGVRKAIQA